MPSKPRFNASSGRSRGHGGGNLQALIALLQMLMGGQGGFGGDNGRSDYGGAASRRKRGNFDPSDGGGRNFSDLYRPQIPAKDANGNPIYDENGDPVMVNDPNEVYSSYFTSPDYQKQVEEEQKQALKDTMSPAMWEAYQQREQQRKAAAASGGASKYRGSLGDALAARQASKAASFARFDDVAKRRRDVAASRQAAFSGRSGGSTLGGIRGDNADRRPPGTPGLPPIRFLRGR